MPSAAALGVPGRPPGRAGRGGEFAPRAVPEPLDPGVSAPSSVRSQSPVPAALGLGAWAPPRAGQRLDLSWGEPRSPRLQPPPRGRAGPQPMPRARAGSRGYCCANTVHCGPRLRSPLVRGIRRPISGPGPGAGGPAGQKAPPRLVAGPALLSRLGLRSHFLPHPAPAALC